MNDRTYTQAELDAAIAAERERCANVCEQIEDDAYALWRTLADPTEQGRSIGAGHCADAIRALDKPYSNEKETT